MYYRKSHRLIFSRAKSLAIIFNELGMKMTLLALFKFIQRILIEIRGETIWLFLKFRSRNQLIKKKIHGKTMYLDPFDKGISKELAIYGNHEPVATQLIQKEIEEGDVIVDIGANIGYFVLIEAGLVNGEGKIVALEPSPQNARLLKHNVEKNKIENVFIHQIAVGEKTGKANLYLSEKSNRNSLIPRNELEYKEIEVNVTTLDDLLEKEERVNLIRMDIEGGEFNVINGMEKTLKKFRPKIFLELHSAHSAIKRDLISNFFNFFKVLDYDIKYVHPSNLDYQTSHSIVKQFLYGKQKLKPGSIDILEKMLLDEFSQDKRLFKWPFHIVLEANEKKDSKNLQKVRSAQKVMILP
jgi:FkbM family methyltransferase